MQNIISHLTAVGEDEGHLRAGEEESGQQTLQLSCLGTNQKFTSAG